MNWHEEATFAHEAGEGIHSVPEINPAALIVLQGEAIRDLEKVRKHIASTAGKPGPIRTLAEEKLLDAIARSQEFGALTLEAF